jgi:phage replication initiation protein
MSLIGRVFRRELIGEEGRGIFGFDQSIKLFAKVGSGVFAIGCLAFGGEAQRGRWMLQLTGAGCPAVRNWGRLAILLKALDARITRLDLAVDYLDGEYTVDDAVRMHDAGEFNSGGRPPSTSVAGDWLSGEHGRTLYVGSAKNGKMLRVYEKGLQLGDPRSQWVRFEVQLGNRDRVIPFEAMTERDQFLAGCYPALQQMLGVAAESIETSRTEGAATLSHLMFHMKRSYGKLFSVCGELLDASASDLIEAVRVIGVPRRLKPAAVGSGLSWQQLICQIKKGYS